MRARRSASAATAGKVVTKHVTSQVRRLKNFLDAPGPTPAGEALLGIVMVDVPVAIICIGLALGW